MLATAILSLFLLSRATPAQGDPEQDVRAMSVRELLQRQASGPWLEKPGQWDLKPECIELRRRVEEFRLSTEEWQLAILQGEVIHTRARWPKDQPLLVWIQGKAWLRQVQIHLNSTNPRIGELDMGDRELSGGCGLWNDYVREQRRSLSFKPLPPGTEHVDLDVIIDQADDPYSSWPDFRNQHRLWQGSVRLAVKVVPTIEEAMPPTSTAEELETIKQSLHAWYPIEKNSRFDLCIGLGGPNFDSPTLRGLAASFSVELRRGNKVVATQPLVTRPYDGVPKTEGLYAQCQFEPLSWWRHGWTPDPSGWEVRFVSSSEGVLPIWEADRWWKGDFSIPLADLFKEPDKK